METDLALHLTNNTKSTLDVLFLRESLDEESNTGNIISVRNKAYIVKGMKTLPPGKQRVEIAEAFDTIFVTKEFEEFGGKLYPFAKELILTDTEIIDVVNSRCVIFQ